MYTLSFIKNQATITSPELVTRQKEECRVSHNFGRWWVYDCIQNYQIFTRSNDKIFWWRMVVITLRYANDYARRWGSEIVKTPSNKANPPSLKA